MALVPLQGLPRNGVWRTCVLDFSRHYSVSWTLSLKVSPFLVPLESREVCVSLFNTKHSNKHF